MNNESRNRLMFLAEATALLVTAEECARMAARLIHWPAEGVPTTDTIRALAEWADAAKAKRDEMVRQ